jgi:hypothetical protein
MNAQLQLPDMCGSGGFRWASFRPVPVNRDNLPLGVASYVRGKVKTALTKDVVFFQFLR